MNLIVPYQTGAALDYKRWGQMPYRSPTQRGANATPRPPHREPLGHNRSHSIRGIAFYVHLQRNRVGFMVFYLLDVNEGRALWIAAPGP